MIYRRQPAQLRVESAPTADQLAHMRRRLSTWLQAADVPAAQAGDIVLVVSEACTNCVEHAYRGHNVGSMLTEVEVVGDEIPARITDSGSWKPPAVNPGNSGRGLVLMRVISDSMEMDTTPTGTTVDITFRLPARAPRGAL